MSSDAASSTKIDPSSFGITEAELQQLKDRSIAAKANAYCPYSKFHVGCALLTNSTAYPYITGANVENAAYPSGLCAERCALVYAIGSVGLRRGDIRALAVATDTDPPASPCGACRQFISEFVELDKLVVMFGKNDVVVGSKFGDLLPMSFGPEKLKELSLMK